MRMNAGIRKEILNRVMKDVPTVRKSAQAGKMLRNACIDILPKKVAAVWKDPDLRDYVKQDHWECLHVKYTKHHGGVSTHYFRIGLPVKIEKIPESVLAECRALISEECEAGSMRQHTRQVVESALNSVTTVKKFKDLFPELAKYAPEEDEKLNNLPMVNNVVTSLRDAGWPAGTKE